MRSTRIPTGRPAATTSSTDLVVVVLYVFGFIVAATLGCTAGSIDLTEGMFRHLVVTGRSRLALYLARIPAGLAIIGSLVAIGFAIVCAVCVFAAPTTLNYRGVNVPAGLSLPALENWASTHADQVVCDFPYNGPPPVNVPCGNGPCGGPGGQIINGSPGSGIPAQPSPATLKAAAIQIAQQDYADYSKFFLSPSTSLMIKTGLWLELEALIGFIVGLGLGVAPRPTDRRSNHDDRPRDHPHPDLLPSEHPALHQPPTRGRRTRHRPSRTRRTLRQNLRRRRTTRGQGRVHPCT